MKTKEQLSPRQKTLMEAVNRVTEHVRLSRRERRDGTLSGTYYSAQYISNLNNCKMILKCLDDNGSNIQLGPFLRNVTDETLISELHRLASMLLIAGTKDVPSKLLCKLGENHRVLHSGLVEDLQKWHSVAAFKATILTEVRLGHMPSFNKTPKFVVPKVSTMSVNSLFEVSATLPHRSIPLGLGYLYDKATGLKEVVVTCQSDKGYQGAIDKFKHQKNDLVDATLLNRYLEVNDKSLYYGGQLHCEKYKVEIDRDIVKDMLTGMHTAVGVMPEDIIREDLSGGTSGNFRKTKHIVREPAADMIQNIIDKVEAFVHKISDEEPDLNFILTESQKFEGLVSGMWNTVDVMPLSMKMKKKYKLRLFYISGVIEYVLDTCIYKPFSMIRRGRKCAIGIKIESGGLQLAFDLLRGGPTSPLILRWAEGVDIAKQRFGVDLSKREYAEGDMSWYDFTIPASFLGIASASVVAVIDELASETLSPEAVDYLMSNFIKNATDKLIYIFGTGSVYICHGTMSSGKQATSGTNSDILDNLIELYIIYLICHNQGDPVLQIIVEYEMIQYLVFGDDQAGGYPVHVNSLLMYPESTSMHMDFAIFVARICKFKFKQESLAVSPNCVGVRSFITVDNCIIENGNVPSLSFLKNEVAHIYLDGTYLGMYPYRATDNLLAGATFSPTATARAHLVLCNYASKARLCAGNLEAYDIFAKLYSNLALKLGSDPSEEDWDEYFKGNNGRTIGSLSRDDVISGFPSHPDILAVHDAGYRSRTGYVGRTYDGDEIPLSVLYDGTTGRGTYMDYL